MQPTRTLRALLVLCAVIAIGIGASILFIPTQFHAAHGIELGGDANLLSEVRAPGGALLVLGALMMVGVFVRSFTLASTTIAAAVYLAYGASRMVSIWLDGLPVPGLVGASVIELVMGSVCAFVLVRGTRRASFAHPRTTPAGEVA